MSDLDLGKTGYGFIVSEQGRYIVHPNEDLVRQRRLIFDQEIDDKHDLATRAAAKGFELIEPGLLHRDSADKTPAWLCYEAIPGTNWQMCVLLLEADAVAPSSEVQACMINGAMLTTLSLILLVAAIFLGGQEKHRVQKLWKLCLASSFILATAIAYLWYMAYNRLPSRGTVQRHAANRYSIDKLKRSCSSAGENLDRKLVAKPQFIPTGVFLQSMEFSSAFNVEVTGYVWQKYTVGEHDFVPEPELKTGKEADDSKRTPLRRGVVFAESVTCSFEEAYVRWNQDHTVQTIGWYFNAVLRQPFDYSDFPFDHEDMWLRMWHKDFDKNVILIPDIDAYQTLSSSARPGLEQSFVVSGWRIGGSYFDFKRGNYDTNFGIDDYEGRADFPELHFNVGLRRNFCDAFISYVVPVLVILFMIYAILLTTTPDADQASKLGFSTFGVIGSTSALFFVALLAHIQLRNTVQVLEIMYLEYCYFITYGMILLVSVYSLLIPRSSLFVLVRYGHGIIAKLVFWPIVLGAMLAITYFALR